MLDLTIGIVGATGLVGQTAIDILQDDFFSSYKAKKVKLYASQNSEGKSIRFKSSQVQVETLNLDSMLECDVILFAVDAKISSEFIPRLAEKNILCIDKSSAFREKNHVPLVVPEVNEELLTQENLIHFPVVSSPNCCVIPLTMVLKSLEKEFGLKRAIVSTYQSVSGAGKPGLDILTEETKQFFSVQDLTCKESDVFPKSIAFNVFPFVSSLDEHGNTDEENKIMGETKKILDKPKFPISVTSVRVPTFVGHAESVTVELESKANIDKVTEVISNFAGIEVSEQGDFITPREAHGKDFVFVSRIRTSNAFENGVSFWIVCDNLRKGAALNALQIIEKCVQNGVLKNLIQKRLI